MILTPSDINEIKNRDLEISEIYWKFVNIGGIDSYVNYHVVTAFRCYLIGAYNASMFFLGVALEEECNRIGLKENVRKRKDREGLVDWAVAVNIINKDEEKIARAIWCARTYFGHPIREMDGKTQKQIEKSTFTPILPAKIDIPLWFKEICDFHEKTTGEKIDLENPKVGWLDNKDTAKKSLDVMVDLIQRRK